MENRNLDQRSLTSLIDLPENSKNTGRCTIICKGPVYLYPVLYIPKSDSLLSGEMGHRMISTPDHELENQHHLF